MDADQVRRLWPQFRRDLLVRSAVQRSMIHPYRRVRQACPSVRDGCRGRRPSNRRHFHSDRSRWQRPNPEKRSNVHNHWRARFYPCHALALLPVEQFRAF